jgi:hypothetical protein
MYLYIYIHPPYTDRYICMYSACIYIYTTRMYICTCRGHHGKFGEAHAILPPAWRGPLANRKETRIKKRTKRCSLGGTWPHFPTLSTSDCSFSKCRLQWLQWLQPILFLVQLSNGSTSKVLLHNGFWKAVQGRSSAKRYAKCGDAPPGLTMVDPDPLGDFEVRKMVSLTHENG